MNAMERWDSEAKMRWGRMTHDVATLANVRLPTIVGIDPAPKLDLDPGEGLLRSADNALALGIR